MLKLEKFTGTKTYAFLSGAIATPEIMIANYPAMEHFVHVVETEGEICYAIHNLSSMRNKYGVDSTLTEPQAILALETILNTPQPVSTEPTTEERIASALELQNLLAMPDAV